MPTPPPVSDTRGADIIVVVGSDLAKATPTPTSPPTTARRTTATTAHSTATTVHTAATTKSLTTTTVKH
jgi:hypothetical protein